MSTTFVSVGAHNRMKRYRLPVGVAWKRKVDVDYRRARRKSERECNRAKESVIKSESNESESKECERKIKECEIKECRKRVRAKSVRLKSVERE